MKKVVLFTLFMAVAIGILIIARLLPASITDHSMMTKPIASLDQLKAHFESTYVKTPQYYLHNNPYLHVATEEIALNRLEQRGDWDAYTVSITPTQLSTSNFFIITIKAAKISASIDTALLWQSEDLTSLFSRDEGYPKGNYQKISAEFQQNDVHYEIFGIHFGDFNERTKKAAKDELLFIIKTLK